MSKQFVDANMLMEIMFARARMGRVSDLLHEKNNEFFISTITVLILYYFAEIESIDREFVSRLVDLAKHLPLNANVVSIAQKRYQGKNFEYCLQAACAEVGGCDEILTLDNNFAKFSGTKLPVHVIR